MGIHAGELVGVGGAICRVPSECERCGKPATEFKPVRTPDPTRNRVEGLCEACVESIAAERDWVASLSDEDQQWLDHAAYERDYNAAGAADREQTKYCREMARATADRLDREIQEFRRARGAP